MIVPDDQLSLAIGREGQNARLAARLTGWRVDIRSETEFAAEEAEHGYEEEEVQGRCAAILSNGRRCPNASLPGSRYCGIESHQALADIASDNVADLAPRGGEPDAAGADGRSRQAHRPRRGAGRRRGADRAAEPRPSRPPGSSDKAPLSRRPRSRRHRARHVPATPLRRLRANRAEVRAAAHRGRRSALRRRGARARTLAVLDPTRDDARSRRLSVPWCGARRARRRLPGARPARAAGSPARCAASVALDPELVESVDP